LEKTGVVTVIVGGTNGKGSTVAALEAVYTIAGYQVGSFTSPMLFRFNEQIRLNGQPVSDEAICAAFASVEQARSTVAVSLTPFEFHTLAALVIFQQHPLDVMILEVGLGGRLDAVNVMDADLAIITSIGIDHTEWLGTTREAIAYEKAGIFRAGKPVVCGDLQPPVVLLERAKQQHAPFYQVQGDEQALVDLPPHQLPSQNVATAVTAIEVLQSQLPVASSVMARALAYASLPGRLQRVAHPNTTVIYDVAHNPDGVAFLANWLERLPCTGKTWAVFSMLQDKDITGSIQNIRHLVDAWYVAPLIVARAGSVEGLKDCFQLLEIENTYFFDSVERAYLTAVIQATQQDRVVVFGSFHTVAAAWGVFKIQDVV
jgi:dihydrofolate synthase/folylpolyglutamate synthase